MNKILPKNESLKRAVNWISDQMKIKPQSVLSALIEEAVFKFDLNPQDASYLFNLYKKQDQPGKD